MCGCLAVRVLAGGRLRSATSTALSVRANRDVGEACPQLRPIFADDRTPASLHPRQHGSSEVGRLPARGSESNLLGAPVIWISHTNHQSVALQSVEDEVQGLLGDIEPGRECGWSRASLGEQYQQRRVEGLRGHRLAGVCDGQFLKEPMAESGDECCQRKAVDIHVGADEGDRRIASRSVPTAAPKIGCRHLQNSKVT
jgi:hypothetical protein